MKTICGKCGSECDGEFKFCTGCGSLLSASTDYGMSNSYGKNCIRCNREISVDVTYCPFCGQYLKGMHKCYNCNNIYNDNLLYCEVCGARKDGMVECLACSNLSGINGANFCGECGSLLKKPKRMGLFNTDYTKKTYRTNNIYNTQFLRIANIAKAWFVAVIFILMFGMSFSSLYVYDLDDNIMIKASTVDTIEIMFNPVYYQNRSEASLAFFEYLVEKEDDIYDLSDKDYVKHMERFNYLKYIYTADYLDAAPFSYNIEVISRGLFSLILIISTGLMMILSIIRATMVTLGKHLKDKSTKGLAGIFAFSMLALFLGLTGLGAAPLAIIIIAASSLVILLAYDIIFNKKRPANIKMLISKLVSAAVILTAIFVTNGTAMTGKFQYENKTYKADYKIIEYFSGVDYFLKYVDNQDYYSGNISQSEDYIIDCINNGWKREDIESCFYVFNPARLPFAEDTIEYYAMGGFTMAITTFIAYLILAITLACALGKTVGDIFDFKFKRRGLQNIFNFITSILMLAMVIIITSVSTIMVSEVTYDYFTLMPSVGIIICAVLFFVNAIQSIIMMSNKKRRIKVS